MTTPVAARRVVLARRVRWLVAATITNNVIEAGVAITAGRFGGTVILWRKAVEGSPMSSLADR